MFFRSCVIAVLTVAGIAPALAQQYPAKTVRIVVPYPPGGGTDLLGRPMAQKLTEKWGQTAIIDNRGGASGMVGAEIAAKSPPDGYTICLCASAEVALNVALYPKMNYDPERDLVAVTQVAISPLVLAVHPTMPIKSVKEFIALAKKRPNEIGYGTAGAGGPHHIAGELMNLQAGIKIVHVPYKGGGPQLADLIGGHVHSVFISLPVIAPHAKSDKVRIVAVTSAKRSQALPDTPTLAESGLSGFDVSQWWGVLVPRGTQPSIIKKLEADFIELTKMGDIRARMATLGAEPLGSTSTEFAAYIRNEIAKYRRIVKEAKITLS
ncbi:MAG TPA: tripartite tricarboxylate transporter substrate binding protein [Burkholderiales bacterium]|nr:tripartite tricarboxylate transporter substrate binding protein [Burkholderiales bacterium]